MTGGRLLLTVFQIICAGCFSDGAAQHKDHSFRGSEFSILKDMRIEAVRLEPIGVREISIEGQILKVSAFDVVTKESCSLSRGKQPVQQRDEGR
jgi:hypothetical protein